MILKVSRSKDSDFLQELFSCNLTLLLSFCLFLFTGCFAIPGNPRYQGPPPRPERVERYYAKTSTFTGYYEKIIKLGKYYAHKELHIDTPSGEIVADYYQQPTKTSELIIIFPILGGKYQIEKYFARYFAKKGYDTAIIHRDKDFKNPDQFEHLEEIFRVNIVRDRIALDFFEAVLQKEKFGSFGISRGAINAAMTAGVDSRLSTNVLALGGSNLLEIFKRTNVNGVSKYRKQVQATKGITKREFYEFIEKTIVSDPKNLAGYLDANHTLLFLSLLDSSVPLKYGLRLRRDIGYPRTIFLLSDHVSSLLYTQFLSVLPPYIELEALDFYDRSFGRENWGLRTLPFQILQVPLTLLSYVSYAIF